MPPIRETHPKTVCGDLAAPPAALTSHFALCQLDDMEMAARRQKMDQAAVPLLTTQQVHAANNDPGTWGTRSAAVAAVLAGKANGVGFALTGTEIGAVDLDHCRDPETGAVDAWAQEILDAAPTAYHEVTVSGAGLRIIGTVKGRRAA